MGSGLVEQELGGWGLMVMAEEECPGVATAAARKGSEGPRWETD